ncbi:MAG: Holliday junction DNA helicase RuvA [Cyclobacteriaceae bacterium]|jgi:Holliday junction DNA helicase RuvA
MYYYLEGKLAIVDPTFIVLDINGVGYEAKISLSTYSSLKNLERAKVYTHFNVKEDSQTLFAFFDLAEKKRFLDLTGISGVGPSTGLMILSSLSADELQNAIISEDLKTIQGVKGIGLKTAQRIILELKDKMKKEGLVDRSLEIQQMGSNTLRDEALSALTTLGINKASAEKSIVIILKQQGPNIKLEELIKQVLKRA